MPPDRSTAHALAGFTGGTARELVDHVELAVSRGELPPGTPLPSVRGLAGLLAISPTTVSLALTELRRRGVVVTEARRGSRIAPAPPLAGSPTLTVATGDADAAGVDARHGGPDRALLPDLRPALRHSAATMTRPRLYDAGHLDPALEEEARKRFSGNGLPAGELAVTGGALDATERALAASLRPGDAVAVEDPGYADVFDLVRTLGLRPAPVAIDDEGMTPESLASALRSGARALVLTPMGQNPTGARLSPARADALADLLAGHPEVLVVEDQHLWALTDPAVSLGGRVERWMVVRSMAKAYGPDLRVALAAGDPVTIARVRGRMAVGPGWVSHVLQVAAAHLLADDAVTAAVRAAGAEYDRRRLRLLGALEAHGIRDARGASGLNAWLEVPDEAAATLGLARLGFDVAAGAPFTLTRRPALRLTPSALADGDIDALAEATAQILSAPRGRGG